MLNLLKEYWNKYQFQSKFIPADDGPEWRIRGLRLTWREGPNTSLSLLLELRAFVAIGLVFFLYIFAGETANQWFYLLSAGLVSSLLLGIFLPLFQVLDVSTACSIPSSATANESVLVKVTLGRKYRFGLISRLFPVKWLLVRANLLSHSGRTSVIKPMTVEYVGNEAWVFAATSPLKRGIYRLESIELYSCFPFGLAWWSRKFESNKNLQDDVETLTKPMITVYPEMVSVEGNFLYRIRASTDSPMGLLSSRTRTAHVSSSVRGIRDFLHGDSPRLIHWASSARLSRLIVREFEAEGLPGFDLLLNMRTAWQSREQFELGVSVIYSLLQLGFKLGGAPDLFLIPNVDSGDMTNLPTFMADLPALPSGLARSSHLLARVEPMRPGPADQNVTNFGTNIQQALLTVRPPIPKEGDTDDDLKGRVELAVIPRTMEAASESERPADVHMPVHEGGIMNRRVGGKSSGRVLATIENLEDCIRL